MFNFIATGYVYGYLWGGGMGAYPSERLFAKTKEALLKEAKKLLKSGGLDSGMGYQSLKGALLNIEQIETIKKGKKEYQRSDYSTEIIGELTEKEVDFLYTL